MGRTAVLVLAGLIALGAMGAGVYALTSDDAPTTEIEGRPNETEAELDEAETDTTGDDGDDTTGDDGTDGGDNTANDDDTQGDGTTADTGNTT